MRERFQLISNLVSNRDSRASYIRGKINVLVPAQLHALRVREGWTQKRFADESDMKQSRVSAMEQPGAVNFNLETLVRSAATHGVGLKVEFVPFSEMLAWENRFSQATFNPVKIRADISFILPQQIPAPKEFELAWKPVSNFSAGHSMIGSLTAASIQRNV